MATTTTAERVIAFLTYVAGRDDGWMPTVREIADGIGVTQSTAARALGRLAHEGRVRPVGVAFDGGRTWTLVDKEV